MMAQYLVIDASTPLIQCGFSNLDGAPEGILCACGDIIESLPRLVGDSMQGRTFQELEGIIYCYGPGSTLGLRFCVTMINVWQKLCDKPLRLFRYSSLDMAANITKFRFPIATSIGSGGYLIRPVDGTEYIFAEQVPPNVLFLQTRRFGTSCSNEQIEYKISGYSGHLSDILEEIEQPELFCFKEKEFVKWDHQRHS
ncbi:MAG: hypothetical protein K2L13_02100 [Opitutales bacterium]|nr:hypothetical protein [Opitutales bacterium]